MVKCIGRVERGEVRSPGDFYTAAFSAVLEVPAAELFGSETPAAGAFAGLAVTSHQFVPLYVGAAAVHELAGQARFGRVDLGWTHAHAAPVDHPAATGTAYLLDWGVLLLHLAQPLTVAGGGRPGRLAEPAAHRRPRRERLAPVPVRRARPARSAAGVRPVRVSGSTSRPGPATPWPPRSA